MDHEHTRTFDFELREITKLGVERVEHGDAGGQEQHCFRRGLCLHVLQAVDERGEGGGLAPNPEVSVLGGRGIKVVGDHLLRNEEHLNAIDAKDDRARFHVQGGRDAEDHGGAVLSRRGNTNPGPLVLLIAAGAPRRARESVAVWVLCAVVCV